MNIGNVHTFKFLLVGDASVGKTSLVRRLCHNEYFDSSEETVGVEFMPYSINIDQTSIKLQIWDTAGQEQYKSIGRAYYRNAVGVLLVFAFNNHESFEHIQKWLKDVRELCHPNANILLIGNKIDLEEERMITKMEVENFAKAHELDCIETSAKTNTNVAEAFYRVARNVLHGVLKNEICMQTGPAMSVDELVSVKKNEKKSCCKK